MTNTPALLTASEATTNLGLQLIAAALKTAINSLPKKDRPKLVRHVSRVLKLLRTVSRKHSAGNHGATRHAMNVYFKSHSAKLCGLVRAVQEKQLKPSWEQLVADAAALNMWEDCGEEVEHHYFGKSDGTLRPTISFGPKRKALQHVARDILRITQPADLRNFSIVGGRDKACEEIDRLIRGGGCTHFVDADLRNCFGSFSRDGVKGALPFPNGVTENVILLGNYPTPSSTTATNCMLSAPGKHTGQTDVAPRGIPQGSLASNDVAARLLNGPLKSLPHHGEEVIYGDDIRIGAPNSEEANANMKALGEALSASSVGPLNLKYCRIRNLQQGLEFLGYEFSTFPWAHGEEYRIRPSLSSQRRRDIKLLNKCLSVPRSEIESIAEAYKLQWLAAFRLWEMNEKEDNFIWARFKDVVDTVRYGWQMGRAPMTPADFRWDEFGIHLIPPGELKE